MYINGINGYLSKFEGTEVDAAVERVQGIDVEFAEKVDKTTTVNGHPLSSDITISAEEVGALPASTEYGKSITWENNILYLKDQNGRALSSEYIEIDLGRWGHIVGNLNAQTDLKDALDAKQDLISSTNMLSSDLVDDTGHTHKFATAEQLQQIATNKQNIATNAGNIATNTGDITTINSKIPSAATPSNQLADKSFVNSSIATNTANFIGTFESITALEAYSGDVTNNDYAFVINSVVKNNGSDWASLAELNTYNKDLLTNFDYAWIINGTKFDLYRFDIVEQTWVVRVTNTTKEEVTLNTAYNRYKATVEGSTISWDYEYTLNNSSFTSDQWAAINSGANTTNIGQIATNENDISTINGTLNTFGDVVTYDASDFATAAQGALADTALQSIDSTMVVNALGYTPYDATNPDGFISGITSGDVTTALGFTPYDATNPDGFISGITSGDVTTALGYTPYDATNPDGFISGITSGDVTTALGFTPYDATNPDGFISSASLSTLTDVVLSNLADGQQLVYDGTTNKWVNSAGTGAAVWGGITGTLADQTDLKNALDGKQDDITGAASSVVSSNLASNRVVISDANGKISASTITSTKLGYLSDVTSNIQVQLNSKISSAAVSTLTDVTLTSLANDNILKYDSTLGKWVNSAAPGGSVDIDNLSITENASNEIQTVGVIDSNDSTTAIKTWTGTRAEYNALIDAGTVNSDTLYNIIDDVDSNAIFPTRNIGQVISSTLPLTDAGLHLLDGALLQYGSYKAFIDYIAELYNSGDYTAIFTTEATWQSSVTTYGICNQYVYDSVNKTVRLPKWGDRAVTKANVLNVASTVPVKGNGKALGFTNGTNTAGLSNFTYGAQMSTGFYDKNVGTTSSAGTMLTLTAATGVSTDATKSGLVANTGGNISLSQYTLKTYYYVVIATTTKTDIEVDIDEIATDLNDKADTDLTNLNNTGNIAIAHNAMPSTTKSVNLTLGASGSSVTAVADGYVRLSAAGLTTLQLYAGSMCSMDHSSSATTLACSLPVKKGASITAYYGGTPSSVTFKFWYAIGSESEAS